VTYEIEAIVLVSRHNILGIPTADYQIPTNHHDEVIQGLVISLEQPDLAAPALRFAIEGRYNQYIRAGFHRRIEKLLEMCIHPQVKHFISPGLQRKINEPVRHNVDVIAHYACYDLHFALIFNMLIGAALSPGYSGPTPKRLPYFVPNLSDRVRGRL